MRTILFLAFAASGFSGLIYESLWTHYLKLFLGHAAYAQSLVLAIFMGGMALGAWLCSRWSRRIANPLRGYALVEGAVGLIALVFHPIFASVTGLAYDVILPATGSATVVAMVKWGLAALLILPQSVLLGATFPLIAAALLRHWRESRGYTVSMLYFTNSLGGVVGVLAGAFWLIRSFGLPGTMAIAGAVNLLVCAVAWNLSSSAVVISSPRTRSTERDAQAAAPFPHFPVLMLAVAAITGCSSFIYEIAWVRLLTLVLGASTQAFELMLAAFILGLAGGGFWIRRRIDRFREPGRFLAKMQVAMGALAVATIPLYAASFSFMDWLLRNLDKTDRGFLAFNLSSHAIALAVMLPATFFAGTTFPLITTLLLRAGYGERSVGAVYGANTLGGIVGVIFAVHVGLPALGLKGLLTLGAALDVGLGVALVWAFRGRPAAVREWCLPALGLAMLMGTFFFIHLDPLRLASGVYRAQGLLRPGELEVVSQEDGKTATVHVLRKPGEVLFLRINGKTDAAINLNPAKPPRPDESTMVLLGALPLLVRPDARTAANIGLGSGITAHVLLGSPNLTTVDTIEIEEAVWNLASAFRPRNERVYSDPRSRVYLDDAKAFLSSHNRRYDIIVSEPPNPWVSGVASLFSREFYRMVRRHLSEQGVFVQWLQMYEIDLDLVFSILGAMDENFGDWEVYAVSDVDLVVVATGGDRVPQLSPTILGAPSFSAELARVGIRNLDDVRLRRVADRMSLRPLLRASGAPANSDYYPYVDQNAVRARFLQHTATELLDLDEPLPAVRMLGTPQPFTGFSGATPNEYLTRANRAQAARMFALAVQSGATNQVPPWLLFEHSAPAQNAATILNRCIQSPPENRLTALHEVAASIAPYLSADELDLLWRDMGRWPCASALTEEDGRWLDLYRAVGRQDARAMVETASAFLRSPKPMSRERAAFLVGAAMLGSLAQGDRDSAARFWLKFRVPVFGKTTPPLVYRLLAAEAGLKG